MENAVDALKIAFAVMVFTIALSVAMATFSQARETSEVVLYMNDKTNYYSWEDEVKYSKDKRIVGIETIIPTLYRYYKENYTVIFEGLESKGISPIYYLDTNGKWDSKYLGGYSDGNPSTDNDDKIFYFDLNSEIAANCPWVGTVDDIKKNLDLFLEGTSDYLSQPDKISFGNTARKVNYREGFIKKCTTQNLVFEEYLGEYVAERPYGVSVDSNGNPMLDGSGNYVIKSENGDNLTLKNGKLYKSDGSEYTGALENDSTTIVVDGEIIDLVKQNKKRVIKYVVK